MISVDTDGLDYKFFKTLNEDVLLKPNMHNKYDIQIENGDYVNVTGLQSLYNAICIAIMTRFNELDIELYDGFGCRVHELVKANKSEMTRYKVEVSIEETLEKIRRIKEVNYIEVTDSDTYNYHVEFSVTSIDDELLKGDVDV